MKVEAVPIAINCASKAHRKKACKHVKFLSKFLSSELFFVDVNGMEVMNHPAFSYACTYQFLFYEISSLFHRFWIFFISIRGFSGNFVLCFVLGQTDRFIWSSYCKIGNLHHQTRSEMKIRFLSWFSSFCLIDIKSN